MGTREISVSPSESSGGSAEDYYASSLISMADLQPAPETKQSSWPTKRPKDQYSKRSYHDRTILGQDRGMERERKREGWLRFTFAGHYIRPGILRGSSSILQLEFRRRVVCAPLVKEALLMKSVSPWKLHVRPR